MELNKQLTVKLLTILMVLTWNEVRDQLEEILIESSLLNKKVCLILVTLRRTWPRIMMIIMKTIVAVDVDVAANAALTTAPIRPVEH